ncbi:MAG: hypothetical protein KR126chlam4_01060 [Candidatus Anoxychlamydiales bacterium]|nr:hypothetical protein [Candidatus Anoxychlamydiales bacterium]
MKSVKNNFKKYLESSRFLTKSLAILAGGLIGLVIASWAGLIFGVVIGYGLEFLVGKAIKKALVYSK